MNKARAFEILGTSKPVEVARMVGVTPQAVHAWPEVLTPAIADRVLAVLARRHLPPELIGSDASVADTHTKATADIAVAVVPGREPHRKAG